MTQDDEHLESWLYCVRFKPQQNRQLHRLVTGSPSNFLRKTFPESVHMAWTRIARIHEMVRQALRWKLSRNMHVAEYILHDVARKIDSLNIPRKVDAVLREKSLLQVVPCNTISKPKPHR